MGRTAHRWRPHQLRRARSAGGPPGVALEPRLPGRPSGASGRRGAQRSPAAAGVAGRELGGVAPRAARGAGGSWGSARWPWRRGARPASAGRPWLQLILRGAGRRGSCTCLVRAPDGLRPAGRFETRRRVAEDPASRERREPGTRLRRREEGAERAAGALPAAPA